MARPRSGRRSDRAAHALHRHVRDGPSQRSARSHAEIAQALGPVAAALTHLEEACNAYDALLQAGDGEAEVIHGAGQVHVQIGEHWVDCGEGVRGLERLSTGVALLERAAGLVLAQAHHLTLQSAGAPAVAGDDDASSLALAQLVDVVVDLTDALVLQATTARDSGPVALAVDRLQTVASLDHTELHPAVAVQWASVLRRWADSQWSALPPNHQNGAAIGVGDAETIAGNPDRPDGPAVARLPWSRCTNRGGGGAVRQRTRCHEGC